MSDRKKLIDAFARVNPRMRLDSLSEMSTTPSDREIALHVIRAYPLDGEDDPAMARTGNGHPIADRADGYVVAYALALDRGAQRERERAADSPTEIRLDASYEVRSLAKTRYATDPNPIRSARRAIEHQAESGAISRKIRATRDDARARAPKAGDAVLWRKPLPGSRR